MSVSLPGQGGWPPPLVLVPRLLMTMVTSNTITNLWPHAHWPPWAGPQDPMAMDKGQATAPMGPRSPEDPSRHGGLRREGLGFDATPRRVTWDPIEGSRRQ